MISVRNLRKSFASRGGGNQFELSVDDFDVPAGCFLTILGSSGCGKSTLLRLIAGLARPDAGSIHIAGSPVFTDSDGVDLDPAERNLGMVFQSHSVWPHLSLIENVAFPLRASRRGARLSRSDVATRVRQALDAVDLAGMESQPVALMSGGQKQRAAIARAIVMRPRLLLLDEPMSSLDADLRRRMRDVLFGVRDQFDLTFVHVTHDQAEALAISDQMAVMKNGRIEQLGTPARDL